MNQTLDTQSKALKKREEHLSKDGQWRSFPTVPHLLQYVSNGNYYGRMGLTRFDGHLGGAVRMGVNLV